MDTLIQAQHELNQRIGRTYENLKKAGIDKITLGRLQFTIELLDKKWAQVEENHTALRSDFWTELKKNDYYTKDFLSGAEESYLSQKGKLLDLERSLQPKPEQSKQDESRGSIESQLTPSRRTVLPKITLPEFSGKYEDWPAFRDHFLSTIDSDEQLPTIEKLHYLRSCVRGEAATMIQNLSATEGSYKRAWKELKDFYENTRLLVRSYLSKFLALPKMESESEADLKRIFHCIINTYDSLDNLGRPVSNSEDLFVHITVELLGSRTRDLWDDHISQSDDPPSFEQLKAFLQRRLQTLGGRSIAKESKGEASGNKSASASKATKSHVAQRKENGKKGCKERCSCCLKDHFLMFCENFRGKSAKERKDHVSDSKLCLNCLGKHKTNECMSKKACTVCNGRHHTLLHDACWEKKEESSEATTSHVARPRAQRQVTILLATARVRVADRFGTLHPARALIDQGSESSFVSENLVQKLRIPRKHASVSVIGVGGTQTGVAKGRITIRVIPRLNDSALTVTALVLPRLSVYTGGSNVVARPWNHLKGLELADPEFLATDAVDILLGADVFSSIVQAGLKKGEPYEPIAQQTSLGWIISGSATSAETKTSEKTCAHQCITIELLTELVKRFWKQEEPSSTSPALTEAE